MSPRQLSTSARGQLAELFAAGWLLRHGLRLIERNYRCRWGELDLIMHQHNTLVVVEVRHRVARTDPRALASIQPQKQQRIARATQLWLGKRRDWASAPLRFDAVGITGSLLRPSVCWVPRAFQFDGV